jgi:hypothetical protein
MILPAELPRTSLGTETTDVEMESTDLHWVFAIAAPMTKAEVSLRNRESATVSPKNFGPDAQAARVPTDSQTILF